MGWVMHKAFLLGMGLSLLAGCGGSEESGNSSDISAEPLEVGKAYNLTITQDEEQTKYYSLQVTTGASYSIDVINDLSSSDIITVQLMADGVDPEVLSRGRMISFDYAASENDELLIKVKGSSRAFFRYHLMAHPSVDDGLVQDDALYEPNNSRNAAYPIINGAQYSSTLNQNDDFDWYALNVVSGDAITLIVSNDISSTSFLFPQLYDENENPLTRKFVVSHVEDLNERINVDYTGRVFLRLNGQSLGTPHRYSFSMMLAANGG